MGALCSAPDDCESPMKAIAVKPVREENRSGTALVTDGIFHWERDKNHSHPFPAKSADQFLSVTGRIESTLRLYSPETTANKLPLNLEPPQKSKTPFAPPKPKRNKL